MQNSAVILKVEYKFDEVDAYTEISITPESGNFNEKSKQTTAGIHFESTAEFEIAKNQASTEEPVKTLLNKRAIYRLTDGNQVTYTLGDNEIKARLSMTRNIAGKPGDKNNRKLVITYKSIEGAVIT